MKKYKGRVIAGGNWEGEAVVSHGGVNTLATFQKSAMGNKKEVIVSDQNNPDIFGKNITGKALCLPITIGSTTGGLVTPRVSFSRSTSIRLPQAGSCSQRYGSRAT